MRLLTAGSLVRAQQGEPEKSASGNRCAFSFAKRPTTLCVNSRKSWRGAAKQNRTHKQNGAGRLLTAPEPSAPSGRCSEAEAGPETEGCAAGKGPWCSATISGLGMVVGSVCSCLHSCVSSNRCAFSFAKRQRPCALIAARAGGVQQSKTERTNKTARGGC